MSIPFTELFPVQVKALPTLHAFRPVADNINARRAAREHGGRWAGADDLLLTDTPPQAPSGLTAIKPYTPAPTHPATYLVGALVPPLTDNIYKALQSPLNGNFRVLYRPLLQPWEVQAQPAISIGLAKVLVHKHTLADYAATIPAARGLVRMTVITRWPPFDYRLVQGIVGDVIGTVADTRDELTRLAPTQAARKRITNAPDTEPVVQVITPFGPYKFAAGDLWITLRPEDYTRLRVDANAAQKASYQDITRRARGVAAVADVLKAMDYIGESFRASQAPASFLNATDLSFSAQVMLGDEAPRPYAPHKLWRQLRQAGLYRRRDALGTVRLGVINALGIPAPDNYDSRLLEAVGKLGLDIENAGSATIPGPSADELRAGVGQLENANALALLLPGRAPTRNSPSADWEPFIQAKQALGDFFSLCLWEPDLTTPPPENALALARALGHTPFALGVALPFVDIIVGFVHTTSGALTQVYEANGEFVGYIHHEGELDKKGAVKLFPATFYKGARVLLHTLTALPGTTETHLHNRAKQLDMTLHISTVHAGANPNLYTFANKQVQQPPTGTAFLMGEHHALLVPAKPAHTQAPVNPLRVESAPGLPVKDALRAILAMNTLHPTARKPRLPVHLHDSTALRRLLDAGIRPPTEEGAFIWWA